MDFIVVVVRCSKLNDIDSLSYITITNIWIFASSGKDTQPLTNSFICYLKIWQLV